MRVVVVTTAVFKKDVLKNNYGYVTVADTLWSAHVL